jgi:hypothetical protein
VAEEQDAGNDGSRPEEKRRQIWTGDKWSTTKKSTKDQSHKLFMVIIYKCFIKPMFVPGRPFQIVLLFVGKGKARGRILVVCDPCVNELWAT